MPMTFSSFESVKPVARYLGLRGPLDNESLEDYREFVAKHDPDKVEAMELRTGKPWNEFSEVDNLAMLRSMVKHD